MSYVYVKCIYTLYICALCLDITKCNNLWQSFELERTTILVKGEKTVTYYPRKWHGLFCHLVVEYSITYWANIQTCRNGMGLLFWHPRTLFFLLLLLACRFTTTPEDTCVTNSRRRVLQIIQLYAGKKWFCFFMNVIYVY